MTDSEQVKQSNTKVIVAAILALFGVGVLGYLVWPQSSAPVASIASTSAAAVMPADDSPAATAPVEPVQPDPQSDAVAAAPVMTAPEAPIVGESDTDAQPGTEELAPEASDAEAMVAPEPAPTPVAPEPGAVGEDAPDSAPEVVASAETDLSPEADGQTPAAPETPGQSATSPARAPALADIAPDVQDNLTAPVQAGVDPAAIAAPLSDTAPITPAAPAAALDVVPDTGAQPQAPQTDLDRVSGSSSEGAPPRFDVVRIDQLGGIVVAGRATPGSTVTVRLGGEELASVPVGANGQFVAIINAPASEAPQALQLESSLPEQAVVAAVEEIIVLPAAPDSNDSAPALVRATPETVELIQPFAGNVDNVSLDTISYSVVGAVVLTGRAQPGTAIRAYADTVLLGETIVGDTCQWRLDVPGLDAGIYTLRIDEVDAFGQVTSRVESPFQRETPEAGAAQALAAQAGGQVIVQPGNTLWLMATQAYGEGLLYTQIFAANSDAIRDPDLIYPGQVFAIPVMPEN